MGRAVISAMPTPRLRLTIDGTASSRVKQTIAPEVQFQNVVGSDGQPYSTLPASSFDTRELTLDALASFSFTDRWKAQVTVSNVLDRRAYRPGSVLIPYLAEGRRVLFSLTYGY
jgi:outer membrane receptor protein involved in Fe transport